MNRDGPSTSLRLGVAWAQQLGTMPDDGKGHGTTRTTFGDQPLGGRKSAPAFGFGAATREQANKVFVSQEHTLIATGGMASPSSTFRPETLPRLKAMKHSSTGCFEHTSPRRCWC